MFGVFLEQTCPADQFRFGREADGTPAASWGWEDLDLWLVPRPRDRRHRRSTERVSTRGSASQPTDPKHDPPNPQGKSDKIPVPMVRFTCERQVIVAIVRNLQMD